MSQEVIEITEREIEVVEVIEKGLIGPTGPTGPQANINYTVVTANQTLTNSQNIAADTSGGSFTLTLPASPNAGDSIDIFDYANTFDTNPLTIARNGQNIESLAENLTANVEGAYFTLIYTGSTRGWQILPRYGVSGIEDVLSAQGDLLYRGASSETRLPIGTAGQVLKVNSGATAPEWGSISGSISVTGSDLTLSGATGTAITNATIANDAVSNAKLSNMAQSTLKGRATLSTGDPEDLSASQVRTILNVADGAEVNVNADWDAVSGDAQILNKPTLGTAAAAATTDFAAAVHTHAASDVTTGTFDNARINFAAPAAIGNTTRNTGAFTTLSASTTLNVTTAGSTAAETGATLTHGRGSNLDSVRLLFYPRGAANTSANVEFNCIGSTGPLAQMAIRCNNNERIRLALSNPDQSSAGVVFAENIALASGGTMTSPDVVLFRDGAANILGLRNAANAQTFNIYNTFTSATNHERGFMRWSSNVFQIGTEAGSGGGTARAFELVHGGSAVLRSINGSAVSIPNGGQLVFGNSSSVFYWNGGPVVRQEANYTLALRDGNNANTVRIYNTWASATSFERLNIIAQSAGSVIIGTEKGSAGGTARALEFQTDGVTRLTIQTGGTIATSGALNVGSTLAVGGAGNIQLPSSQLLFWLNRGVLASPADGQILLQNNAGTDFNRLHFGGTTNLFPALKRSSTTLQVRLADDTAFAPFTAGLITATGNLVLTDNDGPQTATFDAQSKLTANRTYDLPDASGTLALTSDIPKNLWIPASAWIPKTTAGCGVDSRETTTNDQNFDELLFDTGSDEFADALVVMPSNYNNGTVTARFYWTAASGSGGVAWGIQGRAFANDDALDTAAGTAQLVTDTLIAANDMHITSATSAVTIGGTPAANTPIQFTIYRDVSDAADTLAFDARLLGVEIIFN
jgi:hypothetical protein